VERTNSCITVRCFSLEKLSEAKQYSKHLRLFSLSKKSLSSICSFQKSVSPSAGGSVLEVEIGVLKLTLGFCWQAAMLQALVESNYPG